jgi:hypothetical protein
MCLIVSVLANLSLAFLELGDTTAAWLNPDGLVVHRGTMQDFSKARMRLFRRNSMMTARNLLVIQ